MNELFSDNAAALPDGWRSKPYVAPALDPQAFEQHVAAVALPKNGHLARFIERHAPGVPVASADSDGYCWRSREIRLSPVTARGTAMRSLLIAAHECAHAQQHLEMPWLPWWSFKLPIVRLIIEEDAWRRALMMLS